MVHHSTRWPLRGAVDTENIPSREQMQQIFKRSLALKPLSRDQDGLHKIFANTPGSILIDQATKI